MTSTDGVELKSSVDTELPWKMVAKGSRSSTRRNKKTIARVSASSIEVEDKSSMGTVTGKSEAEKLSVPVQGQHITEKVEHIPIKKRKFMVHTLSSSKRASAQRECSKQRVKISHTSPVSRLNPNLIGKTTSEVCNERPDSFDYDFYAMEILASVACGSDMSIDPAPAVELLPAETPVVQKQVASTHVEGDDLSAETAFVSKKCTAGESSDLAGGGKNVNVAPQRSSIETLSNDLTEKSSDHVTSGGMVSARKTTIALSDESSTERPKVNMKASESENVASDNGAVTVSEKPSADEPKDVRLHWDLNVTMDAWGQPCVEEDEASGRDVGGVTADSVAPKESKPVNGSASRDDMDVVTASDGHAIFSSPSRPKAETVARNGKECQSGYESQFEDGELRDPYPWEENEGDTGEIEQVDYGSEPEDERLYSIAESNDNRMEDSERGILTVTENGLVKDDSGDAPKVGEANEGSDIEKHVVVCVNDSHLKKGSSSPSRSFGSKPYKELPSDDTIQRRKPYNYEELGTGQDKFLGRDDRSEMRVRNRSPGREYYSRWDSKRRFSPTRGGSYGFRRPQPRSMVDDQGMVNDFDQSGSGSGRGSGPGPDGYVRRQFSNGGYRGRFRRVTDGGDRDFRAPQGENNQFPGRMNNRIGGNRFERGNSPVFRRLHRPQSESRSRSRSPVSWNSRNRSSPPPGGFRADERMTERVRLPFQKRFPADQEMGFMSPPRNRISSSSPRFFEGRNNESRENFRERKFRPGQRFDNESSIRRFDSDNNNNHFRPFIRHRRFEGSEENTGRNRFDMVQQRNQRGGDAADGGGDDIRRFRFNGEQPVAVGNNSNKDNKES